MTVYSLNRRKDKIIKNHKIVKNRKRLNKKNKKKKYRKIRVKTTFKMKIN